MWASVFVDECGFSSGEGVGVFVGVSDGGAGEDELGVAFVVWCGEDSEESSGYPCCVDSFGSGVGVGFVDDDGVEVFEGVCPAAVVWEVVVEAGVVGDDYVGFVFDSFFVFLGCVSVVDGDFDVESEVGVEGVEFVFLVA